MTRTSIVVITVVALTIAGCAFANLQRPDTDERASCGWIPVKLWYKYERAKAEVFQEVRCIDEHLAQGYRIAASPY
jgi:hypothetical protein